MYILLNTKIDVSDCVNVHFNDSNNPVSASVSELIHVINISISNATTIIERVYILLFGLPPRTSSSTRYTRVFLPDKRYRVDR